MKISLKSCFKIALCIFCLYLAVHYWPAISGFLRALLGAAAPLLIGFALAYVLNLLMSFYEKHYFPRTTKAGLIKSRRFVCMLAAILSLLAIITLIVWLILPQLVDCVELLIAQLPDAIRAVITYLDTLPFFSEDIISTLNGIDWNSKIGDIANMVTSGVGSVVNVVIATVSSVFSGLITAFMAVIFAVYLLMGRDKLKAQSKRLLRHYLKPAIYEKVMYVLGVLNNCFHRYITGQCLEAVIIGALCALGMVILRLPYPSMVGALIAFTALIPVAGAYIGAVIGAFMILMVSPIKALVFLIFLVILQQVEGNLIYPKVVGSSMGLPGIWVLAAVVVGGGVAGIMGMLIGVPLAATVYTLIRNDMCKNAPKTAE